MDLVKEFKENGHNIFVVSPIQTWENKSTYKHEESGITFLKVRTGKLKKNNFIEKGINTLLIETLFKKAINKFLINVKFDLILYSTPPITFAKVIDYFKQRDEAKTYLLLKDIFPQNAVDLNLFKKNSLIYKYFRRKEKYLYNISDYIGCMSPANVGYILDNNKEIDINKVEVNPNSLKIMEINTSKDSTIQNKYNIPQDKIKFIYGGNLGKPQNIPYLIDCLKANEANPNAHFIVVGSGTDDNFIRDYYNKRNNNNLTFIEHLPKEEYDNLVAIADVGMIFLDSKFTIPNFPSRVLSYMEAKLPILTATDKSTDIGNIVYDNNFGYGCISDNVENFNNILPKFYNKKDREIMGENARQYLENNYTVEHSYKTIMNHFN